MNIGQLLSEKEVSTQYGLSISWLRKMRMMRSGPRFMRLGRLVKYCRADLEAYLAAHIVETRERATPSGPEGTR